MDTKTEQRRVEAKGGTCDWCDYEIGTGHEEGCPNGPAYRRRREELEAAEVVWVCEKGHVDDHHLTYQNSEDRCSRCGGRCEPFKSLDALARALIDARRSTQQPQPKRRPAPDV